MSEKKLNNQIAVAKNSKTLLEFLDAMYFTSDSAWPEMGSSRIRIAISDYSVKGEKPKYKWDNIKAEAVEEMLDVLDSIPSYNAGFTKTALNELEHLERMFSKNPGIDPEELAEIRTSMDKLTKEMDAATKQITIYEEHKILPYESYKNPENETERLTTGAKIVYNPAMRFPIIVEIGQGYATPAVSDSGQVTWKNEHDYVALKKLLSVKDFKRMLKKVQVFYKAMISCGLEDYYAKSTQQFMERSSMGVAGDVNDAANSEE